MVLHSPHSPLTMECKYDHYETMSPVSPATSNRGVHCSPVSLMVEMPWRWQAKCPSKSDQVGREKNWENTNIKQMELNFGYLVLEFCDCLWDSSISTQTSCTLHLPSTIIRRISSTQGKCEILFLFLRQLLNSKEGKNNSESPRNVLWWQQFFPHLLPCYIRPLFCLAGKCLFVDRRAASARTASVSQNRNQRNTTRKSSSFTECPGLKTVKTVTACKPSCVKTLEPTTLQCLKHQTTPQRNPIGSSRDTEWNMIHSYPLHGSPWVLKQGTWPSKFFPNIATCATPGHELLWSPWFDCTWFAVHSCNVFTCCRTNLYLLGLHCHPPWFPFTSYQVRPVTQLYTVWKS